jgi:hypothetical protein
MPDLISSLDEQDTGHFRIIAGFWGVDLDETSRSSILNGLKQAMLEPQLLSEMVASLPEDALKALETVQGQGGRIPWSQFSSRYGIIREMGAARRDREAPYLAPVSASEVLFYRGMIARAFFNLNGEPQEVVYIPDDLLASLPAVTHSGDHAIGKQAQAESYAIQEQADDLFLDHLCTMLAAIRAEVDPLVHLSHKKVPPAAVLKKALETAGIVNENGSADPEAARRMLEVSRGNAMASMLAIWQHSQVFNDFRLIPGLEFEGEWKNDPLKPRQFLMKIITALPAGVWWDMASFCADIRLKFPEFLRASGEFDSWYIRSTGSDTFLRGIEHWDDVEGIFIRFFLSGPLHWLGLVDLGFSADHPETPTAFRLGRWSGDLLQEKAPVGISQENEKIVIFRNGKLVIPRLVPRSARYQAARFCEWIELTDRGYEYRITPASLRRARKQNLRPGFLISLLRKYGSAPPQPDLVRAVERWEENETQAVLEPTTVLRVTSPEIITELRASKASRYLGDSLGPAAVIIKSGALAKVQEALAELGYLSEVKPEGPGAV